MEIEKAPKPTRTGEPPVAIVPKVATEDDDVAAKILLDNEDALVDTITEADDRKLRWKLDLYLLPVLAICANLNGVDKISISTAALYGLREDTGLHGSQFAWVGSVIYFGGLLAVFPTSWAMHRFPIGKYYAINIIAWGSVQMAMAGCQNYAGLLVCRILLGATEACSTPCITIMYTMYYKKSEQPLRNVITFAPYASVINGLIGYALGFVRPGATAIETWRWLFLVLGGITVLFGIFVFFFLPNNPGNARWLSDREKAMVVLRVQENQTGIENKIWKWYQFKEALLDYKTWLLFFYIVGVTIPNGGLNTFNGLVLKNLGFTSHTTTLLQMPTGFFSGGAALIASLFAAKTVRFRTLLMACSLLVPIMGTGLNIGFPTSQTGPRLAGVYMIYTFFAGYMLALSMYQANYAGHTKKVTVSYTMYVAYAIGNIIGPQTFIADQAPRYTGGIVAMLVCYCTCIGLAVTLGLCYRAINKRR